MQAILSGDCDLKNYNTEKLVKQLTMDGYDCLTKFNNLEIKKAHDELLQENNVALIPTDLDSVFDKIDHDAFYRVLLINHAKTLI